MDFILDRKFNAGNTITVAVAIYKNNLKKFLKLSLFAHLWLLIPVYGWARYFATASWISKLSFDELSKELENLSRKQYFRINSLFNLSVIAISSMVITMLVSNIVMIPLSIILPIIWKAFLQFPSSFKIVENENFLSMLGFSALFVLSLVWTAIYARLFITDLAYGNYLVNKRIYPYPINRSYHLTKNNTFKIYKIIWLLFLISVPVYVLVLLTVFIIFAIFYVLQPNKDYFLVLFLPTVLYFAHGLTMPFWQSAKATIFYQLTK